MAKWYDTPANQVKTPGGFTLQNPGVAAATGLSFSHEGLGNVEDSALFSALPGLGGVENSALFTGKGTPWGPKESSDPKSPEFINDPNDPRVQGYDYGPMKKMMEEGLREQRARGDQSTRAGLAAANPWGGTSGSAATKAAGLSGANFQTALAGQNLAIDQQAYKERLGQMNAMNEQMQREYEAAQRKSQGEDKARIGFQDKISGALLPGIGG